LRQEKRLRFITSSDKGHPMRNFSKILEISFSAYLLFQSFLKVYLCKQIHVDLFDVLS